MAHGRSPARALQPQMQYLVANCDQISRRLAANAIDDLDCVEANKVREGEGFRSHQVAAATAPQNLRRHCRAQPRCHKVFGAACDDQFLSGGTERREGE
jgi:hypothetical protein